MEKRNAQLQDLSGKEVLALFAAGVGSVLAALVLFGFAAGVGATTCFWFVLHRLSA